MSKLVKVDSKSSNKRQQEESPASTIMRIEQDMLMNDDTYSLSEDNKKELVNVAKTPICPIYYDEKGVAFSIPSPHDVAIQMLAHNIDIFSGELFETVISNPVSAHATLRNIYTEIGNTVESAYRQSIRDAVLSFFMTNITKNFYMQLNNGPEDNPVILHGVERIISDSVYQMADTFTSPIKNIISCYLNCYADASRSQEQRMQVIFYNVRLSGLDIISSLAETLNDIASKICYGYNDRCSIVPEWQMNRYREQTAKEMGIDELTISTLYGLQMTDYTLLLSSISPMIDGILWKLVSTMDFLNSDALRKIQKISAEKDY